MSSGPPSVQEEIESLVLARRNCRLCMNSHPGTIQNGAEFDYDPRVVSHWSQWLGDLQPQLLVIGQDFGDLAYFERFRGRDDPQSTTNQNLFDLLIKAGFQPKPPPTKDVTSGVFLTNSLLCFKTSKGMSSTVKKHWSQTCTTFHLQPLIRVLIPKAIVALGGPAWESLREMFSLRSAPARIREAAGGHWTTKNSEIFAMGHCGGLGRANRCRELQSEDWRRMGNFLGSR
jgi:hypothetical protein